MLLGAPTCEEASSREGRKSVFFLSLSEIGCRHKMRTRKRQRDWASGQTSGFRERKKKEKKRKKWWWWCSWWRRKLSLAGLEESEKCLELLPKVKAAATSLGTQRRKRFRPTLAAGSSPRSAKTRRRVWNRLDWLTDAKQLLHPPPLGKSLGMGGVRRWKREELRAERWDRGEKNLFGCEHATSPPPASTRLATGEDEGPTGVMSGPYLTSVFFSWLERGVHGGTTSWGRQAGWAGRCQALREPGGHDGRQSGREEGQTQERKTERKKGGGGKTKRNSVRPERSRFQKTRGRREKRRRRRKNTHWVSTCYWD